MKNLGLEGFNLVWNGHLIWKIQQINLFHIGT